MNLFPLLVSWSLAAVISGAIFFVLHERNVASLQRQMTGVKQERDQLQRDIERLSSGRRALLRELDDWRSKAEAAAEKIVALERERDELRKKLAAPERSAQPSPSPSRR